jgi:activator of HSP90 ATPase
MRLKEIWQTVIIEASPNEVYDAYIDPKKHADFTGSPATGSPKVGGRFTAWDSYISGRYIELVKGVKIVHEWKTTEWPEDNPPSIVELHLKPRGKKTELTLIQSKVPVEQAKSYADGWKEFYWEPMKKYFEKT